MKCILCPVSFFGVVSSFLALFIEGIALARLYVLDPLAINKLTTTL